MMENQGSRTSSLTYLLSLLLGQLKLEEGCLNCLVGLWLDLRMIDLKHFTEDDKGELAADHVFYSHLQKRDNMISELYGLSSPRRVTRIEEIKYEDSFLTEFLKAREIFGITIPDDMNKLLIRLYSCFTSLDLSCINFSIDWKKKPCLVWKKLKVVLKGFLSDLLPFEYEK